MAYYLCPMDRKECNSVVVFGSSGLVGGHLLQLLNEDSNIEKIYSVRRTPSGNKSGKITEIINEAADIESLINSFEAGCVFICLGTTLAKAGSKENFRAIDYDYILNAARISQMNGARHCFVISAIGADPNSLFFYNRVKGETEIGLQNLNFRSLDILRPSLITGSREDSRTLEKVASSIMKLLKPIFFGSLARYKAMEGRDIAKAMLAISKSQPTGLSIYFVPELIQKAKTFA